jgi:lysophospholipase L1-like esterase
MKNKKNLLALFVSIAASVFLIEFYFSRKVEKFNSLSSRYYQPYLGFGDFRNLGNNQSPERFGYAKNRDFFFYDPQKVIESITERFLPLFEHSNGISEIDTKNSANLVFVMGASAALGDRHEKPENRFFAQIQVNLRSMLSNQKLQVIPAAIRAFITTQERVLLDLFVLPLKPKLVIFLHGFNDASQWEFMVRPGDPYNLGIEYSRQESKWFRTKQFFAEYSYFFQWLLKNKSESSINNGFNSMLQNPKNIQNYSKSMANIFLENVLWMAKRCEQEQVHCLFVLQPTYVRNEKIDLPAPYLEIKKNLSKSGSISNYAFFLDFSDRYNNTIELFADSVHMKDEGQKLLAKEVVEQAAPFLKNAFFTKSDKPKKMGYR